MPIQVLQVDILTESTQDPFFLMWNSTKAAYLTNLHHQHHKLFHDLSAILSGKKTNHYSDLLCLKLVCLHSLSSSLMLATILQDSMQIEMQLRVLNTSAA